MSQEIPLYCDTCMKYFSGPVSAQQHFESIDHQRKEANKQQAGCGENLFYCSYCNKQCNSLRQFQEHNVSPMHLAVMERASRFNSPAPSPAPQETSRMDSEVSALGDHFLQLSMGEKANDMVGKQSYIFDGTRGYCNVCNLELTSKAHARQHLNGEKHKKKERHFVQGTLGGSLSCALCQVSFSGPESAQQHLASDRHRKREAEAAGGALPTAQGLPEVLPFTPGSPAPAPALPSPPASWTAPPQTPAFPEQPRPQPEPMELEYHFNGNRGRCYVCEIELTSPDHAREHLSGKKHRKQAERKKAATQTASYPLYCQVCQFILPDQAAAQSHYASDVHRQRESQPQQMRMFPARPQATPQESEDTEKKMRYYADPAASSGNQATPGVLYGGTRPAGNTGPAQQLPQDTPVVAATRPKATPQEKEDTEKKVRYYAEQAPSTGMPRTPSGMAQDTMGPQGNPGLARELPPDSRGISDGTSSPATSAAPSSLPSQSGAPSPHNASVDQTCVMKTHSPGPSQAQVTEKPPAVETPRAAYLNHSVPYEYTQEGFICYACGGEKIDNREAIAQHHENAYHNEKVKSWNESKLALPDEAVRSSPLPAMDMKALPPQTACNSPPLQAATAAVDPNPYIYTRTGNFPPTACNTPPPQAVSTAVDPDPYIYTRTGNSTLDTPAKPAALTPCLPVMSPAGVGSFSCVICAERLNGPRPLEQHTSSERHRKRVMIWNHLQKLSPSEDGLVKPIYLDGDSTPWYPCDVCLLLMNTAEVLQKHKQSPKHKEQVLKREQFMNPMGSSFNLMVSGNVPQERASLGASPLTVAPGSGNTEKPRVPPEQNSNEDYQNVWTALKEGNSAAEPREAVPTAGEDAAGNSARLSPPSDHPRTAAVDTGLPATTTAAAPASSSLLKSFISKQLEETRCSNPSSFADVIPASQPPVAADPAHSAPSFSRFRETYDSGDESLEFDSNKVNSAPPSSRSLSTKSGAAEKPSSKGGSEVIDPIVNCPTPLPIQQRVAVVTPGKQTSGGGGDSTDAPTTTPSDTPSDAPGGAGGKKQRPYNPLKNRSKGGKHMGMGGGGDSSDEDSAHLAVTFDEKCSLEDTTQDSYVKFDRSLTSAGSRNGVPPSSATSGAGVAGSGASAGQGSRQSTLPLTDSSKDDVDQPPLPRPAALPGTPLSSRAGLPAAPRPFAHFKFYCPDCNRPMNTKEAYDAHIKGQAHKQKVAGKEAPPRNLGVRLRTEEGQQARQAAGEALISMEPRTYQVELFCKAMSSDSIIFLPTGTGKTVIAAMVVSRMLFLNPRRPVLFLVDKVLLVLQQGQVITRELRNQQFLRQILSTDEDKTENRELKIALLCGGLRGVDATPLYRHDIIVTTAAYCENMLAEGIIHWEDFSLVVLDEAHHCVGKHPYCNIMRNRHLELPPESRPKVLGLTASPAGKNTLEDTFTMLKNLMKSLGDARLSIVEGKEERQELDQFQSKTKITILTAEFTREERQLCDQLKEYIVRCYFKLAEVCKIKDEAPIFSVKNMRRLETERIQACVKEIDDEGLKTFLTCLQHIKPDNKMEARALFDFLSLHASFIICTLMDIEGGAGVPFAVEQFRKLSSSDRDKFDTAERYGLPAKTLMAFVNKLDQVQDLERDMEEKGMHQVSLFGQLRHVLFSEEYIKWGEREWEERPMALVLVRERVVAIRLSEGLQQLEDVQTRGLRVRHVVGHGIKAGDGMRVQQQKRVLDGMRGRRYHIVVATSVAEEGVDIPECELVVTLNPPDSVTALVQMRGRARKQGSNFIVICEGKEKKQKLELLLQREKNMADAAKKCLSYNRSSST